ncbi:MAG: diacylglycerol/lipid kinase family protein [Gemmatimonadaceae bacterium]
MVVGSTAITAVAPESLYSDGLSSKSCLILNPVAGRGGIHGRLASIRKVFRSRGITTVYETSAAGDEEKFTKRAIQEGCSTIVAVGGDGTCGRIAGEIVRSKATCRLAVVAAGTGNDFAKTLGVGRFTPDEIAELVVRGQESRIDVGEVDGHYFVNSCGFGFDASVLEATRSIRFLKGDAVYIYAALKQLFTYRGVDVSADGAREGTRGKMLMVTVSNGRWLGGAFKIAPQASAKDGRLDACFIGDSNVMQRVRLFAGAIRGTHAGMPSVQTAQFQRLTLTFPDNPSMEVDGELRVATSRTVELRCIPKALAVLSAPGALG